jgi:hypothetical protein
MANFAPDLTKRAPRSPRIRLGGYVILPRMLDKGRATLAKKNGEYHYNCPLDKMFLDHVGIKVDKLTKELAKGKGDGEILQWINANAKHKQSAAAIIGWSDYMEHRAPSSLDMREYFHGLHGKVAPKRDDITTWFDILDVDDYVTFGGKA